MEAQDDTMGSKRETHMILKGKRTKRQRPTSPLALTMTSTTSSTTTTTEVSHGSDGVTDNSGNSIEFTKIIQEEDRHEEEEEEDMANCLILLAQGQAQKPPPHRTVEPPPNKMEATGLYLYQCKTCNRAFPSFQALGGHRASHKKPKPTLEEKKAFMALEEHDEVCNNNSTTLSLQISPNRALSCIPSINKAKKVHECSICGAEFTSGQALGGHMRRHRAVPMNITTTTSDDFQEAKKPKTLLSLDLNLPAPEDIDDREPKFSFGSKDQLIVFSTSPLVDCHF